MPNKKGRLRKLRAEDRKNKKEPEKVMYDWTKNCSVCGQSPIWVGFDMCGPCITGEADTLFP